MRGWRKPPFEVVRLFARGLLRLLPPGAGNFKKELDMVAHPVEASRTKQSNHPIRGGDRTGNRQTCGTFGCPESANSDAFERDSDNT